MTYDQNWRSRPRKPHPERLGAVVREARTRLGLTQHELALRMGVQGSFISKIETGRVKQPSLHFVGPLAAALGMPVAELYEAATGTQAPAPAGRDLPSDVHAFARWLAAVPAPERERVYVVCRAMVGLLPPDTVVPGQPRSAGRRAA